MNPRAVSAADMCLAAYCVMVSGVEGEFDRPPQNGLWQWLTWLTETARRCGSRTVTRGRGATKGGEVRLARETGAGFAPLQARPELTDASPAFLLGGMPRACAEDASSEKRTVAEQRRD